MPRLDGFGAVQPVLPSERAVRPGPSPHSLAVPWLSAATIGLALICWPPIPPQSTPRATRSGA